MRRFRIIVGMIAVSCLLAGCDGGSSSPSVTPDEAKAAQDIVLNKWKDHRGPMMKGKKPTSAPHKAK